MKRRSMSHIQISTFFLLSCFAFFVLACFAWPPKVPPLFSTHHERHVAAFRSKKLEREVAFPKKCTRGASRCILLQLPPLTEIPSWACGPCWCVRLTKLICCASAPTGGHLSCRKGHNRRNLYDLASLITRVAHNGKHTARCTKK